MKMVIDTTNVQTVVESSICNAEDILCPNCGETLVVRVDEFGDVYYIYNGCERGYYE